MNWLRNIPVGSRSCIGRVRWGLGTAYVTGFQMAVKAGADAVGQMDADFSHPPEKLVELADALKSCDVAVGSRYVAGGDVDKDWPIWRKRLSAFANLVCPHDFRHEAA